MLGAGGHGIKGAQIGWKVTKNNYKDTVWSYKVAAFKLWLVSNCQTFKISNYFSKYIPVATTACTAGVACVVLICVDYAICHKSHDHRLTDFSSTITLIPWLQLSRYCMCHSTISCASTSREWTFLLCCSIWSKRLFCTCFTMMTVQHFTTNYISLPNILVNFISSDHTAYSLL